MGSYCELHCHDEWSLLDGVGTALQGAERAAELGHPALTKTNHGSLSGTIHHMRACHEVGIMPIVGVEAYYRPERISKAEIDARRAQGIDVQKYWEYFHMILLAKNLRGWRSLKLLTSEAYRSGFYRVPCVDDELLDKWNDGLIISTTCISGFIPRMILRGDEKAVAGHMDKLDRWVGDDWYGELQPHDFDDQRAVNLILPQLVDSRGKPLVAARDAHFMKPEWAATQKISVMMRTRDTFEDQVKKQSEKGDDWYDLAAPDTCYIGDAADTAALFDRYHPQLEARTVESAIGNTMAIASRITPFLIDRSPKVPRYEKTPEESYAKLRKLVFQGLEETGRGDDQVYLDQAEHELKILKDKDFSDFFLITWDFVRWARSTDPLPALETGDEDVYFQYTAAGGGRKTPMVIGVRGSAGGSVVSYALRIITINPITWGLRFERFLNPDREGLPDIDLDFAPGDADLVKEYIKRRHGHDKAYDMIAHGTLQAKAAIGRVSTVFNVPHQEYQAVTKLVDKDQNSEPISDLRQSIIELDRFFDRHPDVFEHACRLQGQIGTISEHAAGVVLSDRPLSELMPVMKKSVDDDYMVTAFGEAAETQIVSSLGFLKLDLLVIIELAKLAYAVQLIGEHYDEVFEIDKLAVFEDPYAVEQDVMDIFRQKLLWGVFQYSGSPGIMALTKQLQPDHMFHLCALNAVYRPATLVKGVAADYVARRHNPELIEYWDPSVKPFLEETYGLMIYQEQVMDIMTALGGFSASRADAVRKIMSKWYRARGDIAEKKLGAHREDFLDHAAGIVAGGKDAALGIWDFAGGFSDYSFNKSHAGVYSVFGYADAKIKRHFPKAFYTAQLTFPPAKVKKPEERRPFYERAVREARMLDVRILPPDVNESGDAFTITKDGVRFGLRSVKGVGPKAVDEILERRPFSNWSDFEARTNKCNAAGRRALGSAGALDRWGVRDELTEDERVEGEQEKIGVAISTPDRIGPMRDALSKLIHTEAEVETASHGDVVVVGGEIVGGKETSTKKGPALRLTIAFGADEYKVSFAPWKYNSHVREIIDEDKPVLVRGTVDRAYGSVQADSIDLAENVVALGDGEREHVAA